MTISSLDTVEFSCISCAQWVTRNVYERASLEIYTTALLSDRPPHDYERMCVQCWSEIYVWWNRLTAFERSQLYW